MTNNFNRVLVVIPTYNEAATIEDIIARTRKSDPAIELLVVDDASPDGTGKIVDEIASADNHVHVLHRTGKQGLGAAYVAGFTWGLEKHYDALVEMDADGSHQPEQLPDLLTALNDADLVLGSRYIPGGRVVNWSKRREILSRLANTYTRILLGIRLRDATAGFRAFRAAALRRFNLESVISAGYCFQIDLAWRAVKARMRVTEVPITFVEREYGTSKMSPAIVREALWRVARWGIAHRLRQARSFLMGPSAGH